MPKASKLYQQLIEAIKDIDIELLKKVLIQGANPNSISDTGMTPLHLATESGALGLVELLLQYKAYPNPILPENGYTPLHLAAEHGLLDIAELLLNKGAIVNKESNAGSTPLHRAAFKNHLAVVSLLLNHSAAVDKKDIQDNTPLIFAISEGHAKTVALLLTAGAQVNLASNWDNTPLHMAAKYGHLKIIQLLLDNGAKIDSLNKGGYTPLHWAIEENHLDAAELLLKNKADPNKKDSLDRTPLHRAAYAGQLMMIKLLLQHKANVNLANLENNISCLHVAVIGGHLNIVNLLLESGSNIDHATNPDGLTPLHLAAESDHLEIVVLLLRKGSKQASAVLQNIFLPIVNNLALFEALATSALLENPDVDKPALTSIIPELSILWYRYKAAVEGTKTHLIRKNPDYSLYDFCKQLNLDKLITMSSPIEADIVSQLETFIEQKDKPLYYYLENNVEIIKEIIKMKKENFHSYHPFHSEYSIFSIYSKKNPDSLALICTQPVQERCQKIDLEKEFPHFYDQIKDHLKIGDKRREDREKALEKVIRNINYPEAPLNPDTWKIIAEYLSLEEIQKIMASTKPPTYFSFFKSTISTILSYTRSAISATVSKAFQ